MHRLALALSAVLLALPAATAQGQAPQNSAAQATGQAAAPKAGDKQPVTVDADRMERLGKEGLVIFTGSVVARQNNSVQYADRMEVYFDERGDRIARTVSTGSVKIITRDCRTGTAKRAEYFDLEQRLVLSGSARVWQDENVVTGDVITIFLSQDRSVVQGGKQDRVKAVFYPRDDKDKSEDAARKKEAATAKPTCMN
jgi:lipopolysaccharide export system protein LptA